MTNDLKFFQMTTGERGVAVISNMDVGDITFMSSEGTWNVSRALRDCLLGKHRGYIVDLAGAYEANKYIEVDQRKISAMVRDPKFLTNMPPLIMVMEAGKAWLIDGHHRLRALLQLKQTEARAYVIEEQDSAPYRIYFNGKRVMPGYESK